MIRHIVGFRLSSDDTAERRSNAGIIKNELEALGELVPRVVAIEVGLEIGDVPPHWDAVLVSDFATRADLNAYQVHPEHVRAAAYIGQFIADRAIVDYEF